MGCHTWFSVPYITDREEIRKLATEHILKDLKGGKRSKKWNEPDFPNNIFLKNSDDTITSYASDMIDGHTCILDGNIYMDVLDYELMKYNERTGSNISKRDYEEIDSIGLFNLYDCFRAYGYPDNILRSYEETIEFICTYQYSGIHAIPGEPAIKTFEDTDQKLKLFFARYPCGIITFG